MKYINKMKKSLIKRNIKQSEINKTNFKDITDKDDLFLVNTLLFGFFSLDEKTIPKTKEEIGAICHLTPEEIERGFNLLLTINGSPRQNPVIYEKDGINIYLFNFYRETP